MALNPGHFVVANPRAGNGRCRHRVEPALERLANRGLALEPVHWTTGPGSATPIVRDAYRRGFRSFLACGGDGTAFEVLNGFAPLALADDVRCRFGLLPFGTGNSFAADLRREPEDRGAFAGAADLGLQRYRPVDILRLAHDQGESFVLGNVSFGFPVAVASLVNRRLKAFGVGGYAIGVVLALAGLRSLSLRMTDEQGRTLDGRATFVCLHNNATVGGNMRMAPAADPTDGHGDLVWCEQVSRRTLLRAFPSIFRGRHVGHPALTLTRFESLTIETAEPVEILVDGETMRCRPRSLGVLSRAVEVAV